MIVYKCNATWNIQKRFRKYVKMRTSDKNKRWHMFLKKIRGHRYWWKEVI